MNYIEGGKKSSVPQIRCMLLLLAVLLFSWTNCATAQNQLPLTLQDGLKIVTEESRVVKIARSGEDMAVSDMKMARAGLFPASTHRLPIHPWPISPPWSLLAKR